MNFIKVKWQMFMVLFVLFLLVAVYSDLLPEYARYKKTQAEMVVLQDQYNAVLQLFHEKKTWVEKRYRLEAALPFLLQNKEIPSVSSEMLAAVIKVAEENGLTITSANPLPWMQNSDLTVFNFSIMAEGQYGQFVEFLLRLSTCPFTLMLADFSIETVAFDRLKITLKIAGFFIKSSDSSFVSPLKPLKRQIHFDRDPFLVQKNNLITQASSLQTAIHNIKFVGFIRDVKRSWALAMLPSKKTIVIIQNNLVGLEKARFVGLNEHEVILEIHGKKSFIKYALESSV
jgi:Tfp pilus assembly protein PilO